MNDGLISVGLIDEQRIALWPCIPVLILLFLFLLTFAIFPANMTGRHYLSTSPLIGFVFITVRLLATTQSASTC